MFISCFNVLGIIILKLLWYFFWKLKQNCLLCFSKAYEIKTQYLRVQYIEKYLEYHFFIN